MPTAAEKITPPRVVELSAYGEAGGLTVALARCEVPTAPLVVVVYNPGAFDVLLSVMDDEVGRLTADTVGRAAVRALEMSEATTTTGDAA